MRLVQHPNCGSPGLLCSSFSLMFFSCCHRGMSEYSRSSLNVHLGTDGDAHAYAVANASGLSNAGFDASADPDEGTYGNTDIQANLH